MSITVGEGCRSELPPFRFPDQVACPVCGDVAKWDRWFLDRHIVVGLDGTRVLDGVGADHGIRLLWICQCCGYWYVTKCANQEVAERELVTDGEART